jgi:D-sedoheptulose 7-phosphate isomerase
MPPSRSRASEPADPGTSRFRAAARRGLQAGIETTRALLADEAALVAIGQMTEVLVAACRARRTVVLFGNGGSAADAQHLAAELLGRFRLDRDPLPALALGASAPATTAIGNDYGFEEVFSRPLAALTGPGAVAIGLSTSGRSPNVLRGLEVARAQGATTFAWTGADPGPAGEHADVCLRVPVASTARVQEAHMLVGHILCELVESELFG